jgi:hypothetical protein
MALEISPRTGGSGAPSTVRFASQLTRPPDALQEPLNETLLPEAECVTVPKKFDIQVLLLFSQPQSMNAVGGDKQRHTNAPLKKAV